MKLEVSVEHPSGVRIPSSSGVQRVPVRPLRFRDDKFDREFDSQTLFYDVFFSARKKRMYFVGPPLWNLENELKYAEFFLNGKKTANNIIIKNLNRCSVAELMIDDIRPHALELNIFNETLTIQFTHDTAEQFANMRVIFTMSKDNDFVWIKDWATFYHRHHGANALILVDNTSTLYDTEELRENLGKLPGFERITLLTWPYLYGPLGGKARFWDSDFAQYGAMQTIRYKYLAMAKSYLNVDIDEILLSTHGCSIFESVELSQSGIIHFDGHWVESISSENGVDVPVRHKNFCYIDPSAPSCSSKWAACPTAIGDTMQLGVHRVFGADFEIDPDFKFRHFEGVNTGWNSERRRKSVDERSLLVDEELVSAMAQSMD